MKVRQHYRVAARASVETAALVADAAAVKSAVRRTVRRLRPRPTVRPCVQTPRVVATTLENAAPVGRRAPRPDASHLAATPLTIEKGARRRGAARQWPA